MSECAAGLATDLGDVPGAVTRLPRADLQEIERGQRAQLVETATSEMVARDDNTPRIHLDGCGGSFAAAENSLRGLLRRRLTCLQVKRCEARPEPN